MRDIEEIRTLANISLSRFAVAVDTDELLALLRTIERLRLHAKFHIDCPGCADIDKEFGNTLT